MKKKSTFTLCLVCAVAITACKKKSTEEASGDTTAPIPAEQPAVPEEPGPASKKVAALPEQRAAKLGFAKHLPKDIVIYDALMNGRQAFDRFLKTPLGIFIIERMADEGISLDDLKQNDELATQLAAYSEEFFTAYGPGANESFDLAVRFFERLSYYGGRFAVYALDAQLRSNGQWHGPSSPEELISGPLKGAPGELVEMFSAFDMPAYYQGVKVSDDEMRGQVLESFEQTVGIFQMMPNGVEEITIKRGDAEFKGSKLVGAKLAEMITDDAVKELQKVAGIADIEAFKKALGSKNLVALTGVVGDYVILFFGESEDDLKIVDDIDDSICANEQMDFIDEYLDKDLLMVGLRDEGYYKALGNMGGVLHRVLSSMTEGLADGLGVAGSLGDAQDLEALLGSLSEQGRALSAMFSGTTSGYVSYIEDGIKVESFGGSNLPSIDFNVSHSLAPLASGDNTLLFANWASSAAYNEKVMEYIDTLGEAGYLLARRIGTLDMGGGQVWLGELGNGLGMFDQMLKEDILEIWKALRGDMAAGLGSETAIVIDVNGSLPKVPIPDVPEEILKEGKMPRIAYVSTVDDREKLKQSWQRLNKSIENLLKKAGEMSGGEIPMQVPMSSEKNALTTWFIPIPFQNDDFVPSVSVSDDLFFASTSKKFSEGLAERVKSGDKEGQKGALLYVDFKVLHQYAESWLNLVEKNLDKMTAPESAQRQDFEANKEMFQQALDSLSTLDELTLHTRREEGRTRMSMHLKAR